MRVDSWDMCIRDRWGKGGKPSLRDPFKRIGAPNVWVSVGSNDRYHDIRVIRDQYLMDEFSVDTFQGFRERQDNVSARPIKDSVGKNRKSERGLARTFWGGMVPEGKDEGFL